MLNDKDNHYKKEKRKMNKKVALISGIVIVGLIGGTLLFGSKKNDKTSELSNHVIKSNMHWEQQR